MSLPITMPKIPALTICVLSLIADIIFVFSIKKTSIPIQSQKPQKNYPLSFEICLLFINKTSTISKNFKYKLILKVSSLKITF